MSAVQQGPAVERGGRPARYTAGGGVVLVAALAYLPYLVDTGVTQAMVVFFYLAAMALMWNLLAGYAGLVSVGQQAYVGLGAYAVLQFSNWGVAPFLGVWLAALACAVIALPTSFAAFRLRADYFAVGTWAIAEVYHLLVIQDSSLGGGSGSALTTLSGIDPVLRDAETYWTALAVAAVCVLGCFLLLRGRVGLALTAIRDDETAAGSAGVRVGPAKRTVYLAAAAGCGAAGGVVIVSQLNVAPDSAFSVQWSASMIFIVLLGGIGTLEGPLLGAALFTVVQQYFGADGAWYLIVLGAACVPVAVWLPRGLWGVVARATPLRVFPLARRVRAASPTAAGPGR
ncbi:branched-chain amino acid ABC transporter permease [Actinospica durhamensis]|uniref:Branched-chain amino acid ABC transporter permease n=1 Tax=Actinospica durhamensis TaxID=1508375 RepID=A0A941EPJ1_9ACTN|nr:branched-chain amino acid ABC transporter permease [Actinospica durhamensis]MBR7834801.1 branched-chain amino acid ABC transporter permease [Actinospica durhamensis]